MARWLFLSAIMLFCLDLRANTSPRAGLEIEKKIQQFVISVDSLSSGDSTISDREFHREKLIAALLAFPLPFGISGLHRIYLGTAPWVPVAYFGTLGGAGILALGDFIAIVLADKEEFESYRNNPNLFMWVK
jgi:TM2 domain-containing membrane protein YozV